jgi:hypothetical protein
MTLSVGRFGLNPVLQSAKAWNTGGGTISISGRFRAATVAQSLVLRSQLEGLIDNPDEDAVPIVWSADPSINGWYRVTAATTGMVGPALWNGLFDFAITAIRIAPAAGIEAAVTSRLIANDHSITSVVPWHAAIPGATQYEWPTGTAIYTRATEDGSINIQTASSHARSTAKWVVPPANGYLAACTLNAGVGANAYPVIGHTLPAGHDTDWTLDNGLVQVRPALGFPGMFEVRHWSRKAGSPGYTAWERFKIRVGGGAGYVNALTNLQVIYNAPHRVTIRLSLEATGTSTDRASRTLDLTLRRGTHWVYGWLVPTGASTTDWTVGTDVTVGAGLWTTTLSGTGLAWSLPSGTVISSSNKDYRLLISARALTTDTTGNVPSILQVSADPNDTFDFGIGAAIAESDGSSSSTETRDSQVRQYLAGMAQQPRVVLR